MKFFALFFTEPMQVTKFGDLDLYLHTIFLSRLIAVIINYILIHPELKNGCQPLPNNRALD